MAAATTVARLYEARAHRQQAFIDTGSAVTAFGVLGYALSGRVGINTQNIWGWGAATPLLGLQLNAVEPTRDLFDGGRDAALLIRDRYQALADVHLEAEAYDEVPKADCTKSYEQEARDLSPGEDRDILLAEARRLGEVCRALAEADSDITQFNSARNTYDGLWARAAARDLLTLHDNLLHLDRRLRFTPEEVIAHAAGTPFRVIGNLLTPRTGAEGRPPSISSAALEGLTQDLGSASGPTPPRWVAEPAPLSAGARARRKTGAGLDQAAVSVNTVVSGLEAFDRQVVAHWRAQNRVRVTFAAAEAALEPTRLQFTYSPALETVTARITPRSAPPQT